MTRKINRVKHRTIDLRKIARGEDDDDDFEEEEEELIIQEKPPMQPPPQYTIGEDIKKKPKPKKRSHHKKEKPKLPLLHEAVINATKAYILYQEKLIEIQKSQASLLKANKPSHMSSIDSSSEDDSDDISNEDTSEVTEAAASVNNSEGGDEIAPPSYDAAASGEEEYKLKLFAVKQLIDKGRSDINEVDPKNKRRALHYAGSADLVKMLVEAGAEADAVDDMGCTALHVMSENGLHKAARVVIEFCKRNYKEKRLKEFINMRSTTEGETALHLAVRIGNLQICSFLVSANADLNMYF